MKWKRFIGALLGILALAALHFALLVTGILLTIGPRIDQDFSGRITPVTSSERVGGFLVEMLGFPLLNLMPMGHIRHPEIISANFLLWGAYWYLFVTLLMRRRNHKEKICDGAEQIAAGRHH